MKALISEKNKIQEENLNFDHNNVNEKNNKESTYQYQYEHMMLITMKCIIKKINLLYPQSKNINKKIDILI